MCRPITLWIRDDVDPALRCTIAQVGEGFFEVCVLSGDRVVLMEGFEETTTLFNRVEQLRRQFPRERM